MKKENEIVNQTNESLAPEALAPINLENVQEEVVPAIPEVESPEVQVVNSSDQMEVMPEIEIPETMPTLETNVASPTPEEATVETLNDAENSSSTADSLNVEPAQPIESVPGATSLDSNMYGTNTAMADTQQVDSLTVQAPIEPTIESLQPAIANDQASALQEENVNEKKEKTKNGSKVFLFIILLIIILLIAGGVFAYFKFFNLGPDQVYNKLINKYNTATETFLNKNIDKMNNSFLESGSIKIDTNIEEIKDFKDYSLDYSLGIDMTSNKIKASIGLSKENQKSFDILSYIVENKLYLKSDDIYDSTLLIDDLSDIIDFNEIANNYKPEDIKYLISTYNDALENAIQKARYSSEKSEININGKNVKVTDNIMIINEKNYNDILTTFINQIKNNTRMIEIISNLTSMDKEEIISSLDISNYPDMDSFEIKVDVYTKPIFNEVVGVDIIANDSKVFTMNKESDKNQDTYNITFKEYTGKLIRQKNGKITFTTNVDDYSFTINLQNKMENASSITNIELNLSQDDNYLIISITDNMEYNQSISDINIKNAIDINDLSEEEYDSIIDNVSKITGYIGLPDIKNSVNDFTDFDGIYSEDSNNIYPDECRYATCDKCSGSTCTCKYIDISFNEKTITCPNSY